MPDAPHTPRFSGALSELLRRRAAQRPARRRRTRLVAALATVAAVAVTAVLLLAPRGGGIDEARALGLAFPSGRTATLDHLSEREEFLLLRDEFRAAGVEVRIRFKPVEPAADGRVFSVEYPDNARLDEQGRVLVRDDLAGPVVIVVGRASERAERGAGLTIYEAIPELCALVDPKDAPKTARALRDAGFDLRITVLQGPPLQDGEPAPGTLVVSVLDERGDLTSVDPDTKRLTMEVSDRPFEGHSGQPIGGCG